MNFAPWLIGDRDQLLQTLFNELASAAARIDPIPKETEAAPSGARARAGKKQDAHQRLRQRQRVKSLVEPQLRAFAAASGTLGRLARTAEAFGMIGAGFVGSAIERTGEFTKGLLDTQSISERKAELVEALGLLSRRIVVFIDDLDRLEPREATEVLRLIRAVADLPNIVYVLSYDPEIVARTLAGYSTGSIIPGSSVA